MTKFEKAFANWPKSTVIKENGGGVHITGRYVHPQLAKGVPEAWIIICFAAGFAVLLGTMNGFAPLFVVGLGVILYPFWKMGMFGALGKNVDVKVFEDKLQVRGGFGYKNYDRRMPIEFKIERHQKALAEYQKEVKRGRKVANTYRQAIEVVMQYGEKRIALAELRESDMEMAKALVLRIQDAANKIDKAMQMASKIMAEGEIN